MSLTFVVPTIPGRESLLSRCLWSITSQWSDVLVVDGTASLGFKINAAASLVDADYMAIVDDDDYIASDYMLYVGAHLGDADYIGFKFLELMNGAYYNEASAVGDYPAWGSRTRGPSPKCPTRTWLFRDVRFGDGYKSDRRWSELIRERINVHAFVGRTLYVHDWWPEQSTFGDERIPRDVGAWPHPKVERVKFDA